MLDLSKCSLLSLNVRGLKSQLKRRSIFSYLKSQKCLFYLLQETYSGPKDEVVWRNEWGGGIFFSHGTNRQKGVCILIKSSYDLSVTSHFSDPEGRIVIINLIIHKVKLSICNIYALNNLVQQNNFIQGLNEALLSNAEIDNVIIGGDWNVTLERIDKKGGAQWKPTTYRDKLLLMMEESNLSDVFRKKNPSKKSFTYESKYLKVKSRIDFFLVSTSIMKFVLATDSRTSIAPDHKAVRLKLKISNCCRGPGLWKFKNSLLEDEKYVNLIKNNYPKIKEKYNDIEDKRLKWELIKMEIRSLTIPYSKYKAKQSRNVETAIQKRLDEIDTLITNSNGLQNIDPELKEYDRLKRDLQAIYDTRGKGAIFRSKVRWTEEGEKSTKYFFNIEKRNFNTKVIAELKPDPDGNVIVDEKEIMCEIHSYYADLYKSEVDSDKSDDSDFNNFTAK